MVGVFRGKMSEGIDFSDSAARCVLVIGVPYADMKGPEVLLKKKYLDTRRAINDKAMSGKDWYYREAIRAVNQGIGRVIRHIADFGVIIFADERYGKSYINKDLPKWVQSSLLTL